ncbi:GDP-mannose-dependent alpha-(1-6)-phosphatidylinositol monomannoside mannosyltransferase [Rubripirellula lacrimiformis]|uniref:GDP-mannose-dependent alpha-(1-6)-phosphatidylinositol monomannoside mannosyltransferase n=1 Tax=Rubripirellula lacrimiformis TaxID=1930273 RepID=A0A517NFV0_9BACT|nr:glycosyltransferase [Rubripirellula lacrimiformis]QDT06017.1 GDP-mannose-dependent alpha-(1-6)-phosphatidylinositol monomannoside mannosyltransferase [Rubripirellula lacrimiformis]
MKFALAHHWLTSYRGGERVLEQMASLFPGDIYTLVQDPRVDVPGIAGRKIRTSALQRIPKAAALYRHLLPLHPWAISNLKVDEDVDVLLSSDASLIKGIDAPESATHVCYCHSPPRYLWEMSADYKKTSLAARVALDGCAPRLRDWDYRAAQSVTHFIANSQFVAERIQKYYDRESTVIFPPVAVDAFQHDRPRESFCLVISELVPYKRIDLAVEAFNRTGQRLVIIGDGPERSRLESVAKPNVEFWGRRSFADLKRNLEIAQALIFPGVEDFGITPVEAQAAGCPVIAYRGGGALETVVEGQTGLFFDDQNIDSLIDAVDSMADHPISADVCNAAAQRFSAERFCQQYRDFVESKIAIDAPVLPQSIAS